VSRPAGGAAPVLTRPALNRTTLRRQALLERAAMPALDMVGQLVAVQAQEPDAPYVGLWTRLEGFDHAELARLLEARQVVRSSVLRGTQHLVTGDDYLWLRPLVQPVLERAQRGALARRNPGVDPAELASATRGLLAGRTLTRSQLRDLLAERWPDRDAQALVWAAQALVPVVHPPPAGTWRRRGAVPFTLAEERLGRPLTAAPAPEELLRRYLAAFGPASVVDAQAWSGLTRRGSCPSSTTCCSGMPTAPACSATGTAAWSSGGWRPCWWTGPCARSGPSSGGQTPPPWSCRPSTTSSPRPTAPR
jgi:hypothetical protein